MNYFLKNFALQRKNLINYGRAYNGKLKFIPTRQNVGLSYPRKRKWLPVPIQIAFGSALIVASLQQNRQHLSRTGNNATTEDNNRKICKILVQAQQLIETEQYDLAKTMLRQALSLTIGIQDFSNISLIYDLLVAVAIIEGNLIEAEEMLVRFIEQLLQMGYSDTDNKIVSYKLKLCRLYHMVGNVEMAEVGYQSCVATQARKIDGSETKFDTATHLLYVSSLFWYGRFLTHQNQLQKAKDCMQKVLAHDQRHQSTVILQPTQRMVVLYHSAEVAFKMAEYENATKFLMQAIDLGKNSETKNFELPLYVVKLGVVYLYMKMYTQAANWCEMGQRMATVYRNDFAAAEAELCLEKLRQDKSMCDAKSVVF